MELVPPPERVTVPAGAHLVQCFVCTALFYTREESERHLKLHRKSDIIRAINEYSARINHERHQYYHRTPHAPGSSFRSQPHADISAHKTDFPQLQHPPHHVPHHHQQHLHQAHDHQQYHHQAHDHQQYEPPPPTPVGQHWMVTPRPEEVEVPLVVSGANSPAPAVVHTSGATLMNPYSIQQGWTLLNTPDPHPPTYTDLDAGPSGAAANPSFPISPLDVSTHTVLEPDVPGEELLCTEESLHSSCPSPGEDSQLTMLRPAPEYHGADFSVYSSEPSAPPPPYGSSPSHRRPSAEAGASSDPQPAPNRDMVSFKCIHCSREFQSAEDIHGHLTTVSEATYVCQACHEVCQNTWHLADHMAHHSNPRPYKCGVCGKEFRTQQLHRQHILQHIPAKIRDRVENELSGVTSSGISEIVVQRASSEPKTQVLTEAGIPVSVLATVGTVPPLSPSITKLEPMKVSRPQSASTSDFIPKSEAANPLPAVPKPVIAPSKRKPIVCGTCGASFRFLAGLHRHNLTQHKSGRRPTRRICSCDHCGRIFHSYKQLRWHAEIHGKKPCTCTTCGRKFLHMSWLTRHIRSQHNPRFIGNTENSSACPICSRVYMKSSLAKHIRMMHQEMKPYQCQRCGRRFAAKCNLKTHVLSHMSYRDRPFKCSQCRKAYTTERDLRKHMASHEGKKFPCKVCGRLFTHIPSMNVHLREHSGEKNHACAYCGKRFARKAYLTCHMRIHTGERPHVCSICERSFASKSNYNAHMRSHSRRDPVNSEL